MIYRISLLFLLFGSFINAKTITIAVAANVSYAIDDLKKEFSKRYPNVKVRVVLGGSGKLTAQIKHGAPYQLFMSADMKYPELLYKEKVAITKPIVYAQGSLAYLSVKSRDFTNPIELLKEKNIKHIAIANPKTAPYGRAAFEALRNAKILNQIKSKFIYGESITQTVSYSITAADIGLVAKSSLYSPKMKRYKKGVNWYEVDKKLYTPIKQGIVILKSANKDKDVKAFYNFMLSVDAKKILSHFGYLSL